MSAALWTLQAKKIAVIIAAIRSVSSVLDVGWTVVCWFYNPFYPKLKSMLGKLTTWIVNLPKVSV